MKIRAGYSCCGYDRGYSPSSFFGNGNREMSFFSRPIRTMSFKTSTSSVFWPKRRSRRFIRSSNFLSSLAGTTFSSESTPAKAVRTWDIPKDRWSELGFRKHMTIEQARIRQKQLNAQLNLKRHEESRIKFEAKKRQLEMECAGFLPDIYRQQFEERYFSGTRLKRVLKNKDLSHWRAAQKIILEIQLESSDWFDESHRFYDWFHRRKYSYSYTTKIIDILNLWGFFAFAQARTSVLLDTEASRN